MKTIRLKVPQLSRDNVAAFEALVSALKGVKAIDTWDKLAVVQASDSFDPTTLLKALDSCGFAPEIEENRIDCSISGMHCRSCEVLIEQKFRKLPRVRRADIDAGRGTAVIYCDGPAPSIEELHAAVSGDGYTVSVIQGRRQTTAKMANDETRRPSLWEIIGLFAIVLVVGGILSRLGLFGFKVSQGSTVGLGAAFVIGLVAATSSCVAVSGGLLLSVAAKYNQRFGGDIGAGKRMTPVLWFVIGRVLSYGFFGGVIGLIGKALSPSPLITGIISIVAAAYMLIMGLEMLHLAPNWMKRLLPRMPKSLSRLAIDAEGSSKPSAPFMLGALTFFLPCGFTQALQLYALTTGSFLKSAGVLLAFALGTAPALLALGWASSSLKGKAGRFFFKLSAALIIVLGVVNMRNGWALTGFRLPSFPSAPSAVATSVPDIVMDNGVQVIKMAVGDGYDPDTLTVKAGVPVRWEIDGTNAAGCIRSLVSRQLKIQTIINPGINKIEFTAPTPGKYAFSCSMGMYRGTINAI